MKIGKISTQLLEKTVFKPMQTTGIRRNEIVVRPKIGEDCAVVDFGEEQTVVSSDPITGASENIGYLAVMVNVNDIASSGCEPVGIMVTVLLPVDATEKTLVEIMNGVYQAAADIQIEVIGGHTEVTDAVNRPIVSATILGKTKNKHFISSSGAKVGQDVVMTKWAGLEGTIILANELSDTIAKQFGDDFVEQIRTKTKLLSVLKEGRIARDFGATAMHDVTEGGILGACFEIAAASEKGIAVDLDKISVLPETVLLCEFLQIDPYKLISSGSMLIVVDDGKSLVRELDLAGVHSCVIGEITAGQKVYTKNGQSLALCEPEPDELYSVLHE